MNTRVFRFLVIALLVCLGAGNQTGVQGQPTSATIITYVPIVHRIPNPVNANLLNIQGNTGCITTYSPYGDLLCWGESITGMEDELLYPQSPFPVKIPLPDIPRSISISSGFACYLNDEGGMKCGGKNGSGQLGNNTFDDSLTPVQVMGLSSGIVAITTGENFACASTWNSAVFCWGNGARGQLGIGDRYNNTNPGMPVPQQIVITGERVSYIAAGTSHACAIFDEQLWCWGANEHGQIGVGYGMRDQFDEPVRVEGLPEHVWEVYAGGDTTCAFGDGGLYCWGDNQYGQVGNGASGNNVPTPVHVDLPGYPAAVSVGKSTTCAVTMGWTLHCWGRGDQGQVGTGTTAEVFNTPQQVTGIGDVGSVSVGDAHACALMWSKEVLCWGDNQYGQLGNGTTEDSLTPKPVGVVVDPFLY